MEANAGADAEQRGHDDTIQSSPYFDPTHTRTGWIGQPPILDRLEVVTIDGDVDTLGQATPYVCNDVFRGGAAKPLGLNPGAAAAPAAA